MKIARVLVVAALALCAASPASAETLSHGRFENIDLLRPRGDARGLVLLLTDRGGDRANLADILAQEGALVATVDTEAFFKVMEKDGGDCQFANGDLENLSHFLQAYAQVNGYSEPLLVGQGIGAGFAYGLLAQSPDGTFGGGIGIDFCPELAMRMPLCAGSGLKAVKKGKVFQYQPTPLRAPFAVLQPMQQLEAASCSLKQAQGFIDKVPQAASVELKRPDSARTVRAAYRVLAGKLKPVQPAAPKDIAGLPVVEVPSDQPGDSFAILISGDGGWAGIDKEVAERLAASGVPVAGIDSLRYFWAERTPESAARDMAKLIAYYQSRWKRSKVWLVGYSQGGDVLPFILNRLAPDVRKQVTLAVPIAMGEQAHFEFHLSNWIGSQGTHPILPEMQRLAGDPVVTAICAKEEDESVCTQLDAGKSRLVWLPGGHHFNGDYAAVANAILKAGGR